MGLEKDLVREISIYYMSNGRSDIHTDKHDSRLLLGEGFSFEFSVEEIKERDRKGDEKLVGLDIDVLVTPPEGAEVNFGDYLKKINDKVEGPKFWIRYPKVEEKRDQHTKLFSGLSFRPNSDDNYHFKARFKTTDNYMVWRNRLITGLVYCVTNPSLLFNRE